VRSDEKGQRRPPVRERAWRGDRPPLDVSGRVALLVDDGLATGSTMRAAVAAVRARSPARIVVAVPVASSQTAADVAREVDKLVCPLMPPGFFAVGTWYRDFGPTGDDEVRELLLRARAAEEKGLRE
jgi:putative phosphoribosyl transferase